MSGENERSVASAGLMASHQTKHDGSPDPKAHLPNTVHAGCRSRESDAGTGINGWKAFNTGVLCGPVWKISNVPPSVDKVIDDVVVEQLNEIFRRSDNADFARPALTDAEREAVEEAISAFDEFAGDEVYVAALRGLLERLK